MNLHALDIPDAPVDLAPWLERQLTGLHLAELVAELSAVHGTPAGSARGLEDMLGPHLQRVLESGLSTVPHPVLCELLRQPRSLLDLQERLLVEGGPYWDGIEEQSDTVREQFVRGWQQVSQLLGDDAPATPSELRPVESKSDVRIAPRARRGGYVLTLLAAAATLVIGFFLGDRFGPKPPQVAAGWGWQRPGTLDAVGSQAEYLNHLADSAEEWFKKRPDTPATLARRIGEFRDGCSILLLAEHRPLAPETKAWLRERCSAWAGKLDAHRNGLEAGQDVQAVRAAADDTIQKLIKALRTKAAEVVS